MDVEGQNNQQTGQNPVSQPVITPEKPKTNYFMIGGIIVACSVLFGFGGYYLGKQSPQGAIRERENSTSPSLSKEGQNAFEMSELKNIKIGNYEIVSMSKYNKGWEEVKYKDSGIKEALDASMIYAVFSELYPTYTDRKAEFYVNDIRLERGTAEVYFGGDETYFTDRMGTTGPYNYAGLLTFALTEDPRIKKVHLNIQQEGTHAGPTPPQDRESYIYLWTDPMLRNAVGQGSDQAREILEFRSNP